MSTRTLSKKNQYYVERELYLATIHWCRQYPKWIRELSIPPDTSIAIKYDKERVKSSNNYDPTSDIAIRRQLMSKKVSIIDRTAHEVSAAYADKHYHSVEKMAYYLKRHTCYGDSFNRLQFAGMMCPRDRFYAMRRRFYYQISREI